MAKTKADIVGTILSLMIVKPIWFYLMYKILKLVNATELMWFLFWVYMPVGILVAIISIVVGADD